MQQLQLGQARVHICHNLDRRATAHEAVSSRLFGDNGAQETGGWEHVPASHAKDENAEDVQKQPWKASARTSLAMNTVAFGMYKRRLRKSEGSIIV